MESSDLKSQISNLKSQTYAIIVAGGSGSRMQAAVPKQFLLLGRLPVLMHTLRNFYQSKLQPQLILVLPADFHLYWQQLCVEYKFDIPHQLVSGGETRFHSVKNGLDLIPDDEEAIVAVQDAVRPLTDTSIIDHSFNSAAENGNAVTAVKSRDSVRQIKNDYSVSLVRDEIYLIQTPQTFQFAQLKKAYQQPYNPKFTDDASVVEETGEKIHLIEGSHRNIKITYPEDIAIAELFIRE
jgi:2-C-methyl-D-erythritol 4-phosphate cytidylyltransferase